MGIPYRKHGGEKRLTRTSIEIDKSTLKDLEILKKETGLDKKKLIGKLAKEKLQNKEACIH